MQNKKGAGFVGGMLVGMLVAFLIAITLVLTFRIQDSQEKKTNNKKTEQETKKETQKEEKEKEKEKTEIKLPTPVALPEMSESKREEIESDELQKKIEGLIELIEKEYYKDDIDYEALENGILHGLMDAVGDPYTRYYSPEEFASFMEDTTGKYSGIGAYVTYDETLKYPVISKPIPGSPAEEAGLMPQDVLIAVNGEDIYDIGDLDAAVGLIKGEEGTMVNVTIMRGENKEKLSFDIERRKITVETVVYKMLDDDIAYLQITNFDTVTGMQFLKAKTALEKEGFKGLILDLRGNPGGSLSTVVQIANQMLPKGLITYIEDKYGNRDEYSSTGKNEIDFPMVVLIDGGSASASELLSGAIQDYKIGTLIGTKSFGKGIVQDVIRLEDGSAIKITTSSYYTPNGRNIHGTGIEPDITIEFDADAYAKDGYDNQLEKAKEVLRTMIK